ncbi:MAG: hypothetical protein KC416_11915 [Myxococcales bacterium]|nr:hypothetical protein [Myxococcales bacterium]
MSGKNENYFVVRFSADQKSIDVYVYDDEAGILENEVWTSFERWDHESPGALVESLCQAISDRMIEAHR